MELLQGLVESGRIVDIMLAVIVVELVLLVGYRIVRQRGPGVASIVLNIGAGGSLMFALRLLYDDAGWQLVAAALVASAVFHAGDVVYRWRRAHAVTR